MDIFSGLVIMSISGWQCPLGKFFNIGSCRVLEKIPASGSGLGREGVLKYTLLYSRVSILVLDISQYSWVQGGRSCPGARVASAEKFGLRRKF